MCEVARKTHTETVPFFRSQIICGDLVETLRPIPEIIRKTVIQFHILVKI